MKEKHHFAADVDADYYMANSRYGVSNYEKQSQFVSIPHIYNCVYTAQEQSLEVRGLYILPRTTDTQRELFFKN